MSAISQKAGIKILEIDCQLMLSVIRQLPKNPRTRITVVKLVGSCFIRPGGGNRGGLALDSPKRSLWGFVYSVVVLVLKNCGCRLSH